MNNVNLYIGLVLVTMSGLGVLFLDSGLPKSDQQVNTGNFISSMFDEDRTARFDNNVTWEFPEFTEMMVEYWNQRETTDQIVELRKDLRLYFFGIVFMFGLLILSNRKN